MTLLRCQNLTKRFGSTVAVDSLSLEIPAGEPVALIGPNGAGKTTLLSLICGFIRPTSGDLQVLGQAPGSRSLAGRLSALPQDAQLDPRRSVGAQLRLFARLQGMNAQLARQEVHRVLEIVGLPEVISRVDSQLSHGMRKRVAIAQSLIGEPEFILLDEPTAGVDPPNAKLIRDLIQQQSHHTTFLISSHNLDELERLCATVIYLDKGRLISFGPVSEETGEQVLTLRLGAVEQSTAIPAIAALPSVSGVSRTSQGDYLIEAVDDMQAGIELLTLLQQHGWSYRALARGRSLEQRLYGH